MSQLRAPAARADRREGGRHGRPAVRTALALPETHIRPQLMRLAVLPPVAVALSACAAVLFIVRTAGVRPSLTLWAVLAGALSVTLAGILIAAVAANRAAKSVSERIGALRRSSARGEADLRALVEALRRGDGPPKRKTRSGPPDGADDFELLAADLSRAHDGAVTAVVQAAQLSSQAGSEQKLEVFVNLARRLQSLVHREISILDELENEIEDPDLLKGLFHVDHLATRIRRHAENLAVLGGAVSRRQWSNPVSMTEVLRSAIAEVEQYSRVKLVPPIDGTLRGHAVADVIHLLAELVENATVFSAPHTQVLLRANLVTSGLAVEVEDRGLGMPVGEQNRMNALLADPDQVNVASLLADGRIGLFVVSQLAKRHGIHVRLQSNIYGGVQAVLVVPQGLLGTEPEAHAGAARPQEPQASQASAGGAAGPTYTPSQARPQQAQVPPPTRQQHRRAAPDAPAGGQRQRGAGEAAQDTSRRQQPQTGAGTAPRANGGGPAPLPVRGSHEERANPAEAVPGIKPDERRLVAENTATGPTPRTSTVRGTMGKPQLPRRRAQEHIAPQLRDGPAPRQESDQLAGHDPGLMAAFQRGVGLAETQQHMESAQTDASHMGGGHMEATAMGGGPMEATHMGGGPMDATPMDATPRDAAHVDAAQLDGGHMEAAHMDAPHTAPVTPTMPTHPSGLSPHPTTPISTPTPTPGHTHTHTPPPHTTPDTPSPTWEQTRPAPASARPTPLESVRPAPVRLEPTSLDAGRPQSTQLRPTSLDALHMDVTPTTSRPHLDASPMGRAHTTETHPGSVPGTDHTTTRHDGSAPAG
ncbi:ATP-binding protein [Streptomyces sp. M41]|uniref:sensor histidine kinase n=1 Tax=Streptomyces sp. M41 TaxID=3059412 RepID=UPI00374CC241